MKRGTEQITLDMFSLWTPTNESPVLGVKLQYGRAVSGDSVFPNKIAQSIMLPNEVFALACRAWYEEQGLVVDETNGQFAHCPQPERYGDKGYYLLWEHHQHQGLLQSEDVGECCFFAPDVKQWLLTCDPLPDNYFDLWDIFERYSCLHQRNAANKLIEIKKGIHDPEAPRSEWNREITLRMYRERRGIFDPAYTDKMKKAREVAGKKSTSQVWASTVDGFTSHAAGVANHNKANGWDPQARIRIS